MICCGSRRVGRTFPLRYFFLQINILRFILYSVLFCNISQIDSEASSFACGFFPARVST